MTPEEAYNKCKNEKRRIPELENVIANDVYHSYLYARDVIKGKFEEGEKIISTDSRYSYWYALHIIKGRWEEGEKIIATDSEYSWLYAKKIINHPFLLCHPVVFNSGFKNHYIKFLKSINYDLSEIGEWLI
jgi:hypothetical protein